MADIRINSLPTTASASSSDDFLALDGATNGTRKLNAYSPTFGGNLTVSGTATIGPSADVKLARGPSGAGNLAVTAATDGYCEITARGAAGNLRIFSSYTGGNFNWYWGADASAQTGSNAGSNFVLVAGSDTGGSLGTYLTVNRATAATTLAGNLTVSGTGNSSVAGTLLVATTTNSSNGKIQLATHTTSAGGIGFGTDTSLFRAAQSIVAIDGLSTAYAKLRLYESSVLKVQLESAGGDFTLATLTAGKSLKFNSGNDTLALTLDSSQNATFAGKATATRLIANSQWVAASAGTGALSATANAGVQLTGTGAVNDITLVNKNGDNVMVVPTGTTNATFAGAIAIGNTVQTAASVASTHKVTISIGGVTYYLLATNV